MAANDYYNHSSVGQSGRRYDYDAPLPPLPSSSPLYPTSKPTAGGNSLPPSPFEDPAYPPYPQHSQTSFGSESGYYGAGSGERVQDSSAYADDRPLRPHRQKQSLEEWTGQNQQQYRLDDVGESVEPGKRRKSSRSRKKRSTGFFSGKIPWVVYLLTLVQAGVFIGELVKNSILTKSPIEIHPQFNPMIGPSQYVLINMGARFVPCMRNTAGVQDAKIAISWPCPNTTTLDPNDRSQHCKLSDLCGFSPVPNPKAGGGGAMTDSPEPNQWYRFIIPIFLHAGIIHIGFNMLLQLTLGREMEIAIGSWRFALVYFSSGIFGFVLGGNFAAPAIASTGASGSLFGILALTLLDLLYTWKEHKSPWKELAFIGLDVVISFVLGLLPGLDNFSHIGGFLMGLVLGICLLHSPNVLRQRIGGNEPPYAPVSTGRGKDGRVNTGVQDFVKRPLGFFKGRKPLWWAWWLVRAGALIGVTIGFIVLLNNFYRYKHTCGWCKYLSCLPINNWCSVGNINLTNTTQSSKRDLFSNAVTAPFYSFPSPPYLEGLSQALAPYLRLRSNPTVPESTHGSVKNASESDQATQVDRAVAGSLFSKGMATLAPSSSPSPPPLKRRRKTWARKCERYCCNVVTYLPLGFVYGLTTWAVWVEAGIGFLPGQSSWIGYASSSIGILLYLLLNWSYTTAVFTDPGSPLQSRNGYSHLPTQEPRHNTSFTVKSTGGARFCKKCQARKPDRAHHCSTCQRCVLKMDHHCPWLATCVGLRNYKSFLLFLVYTTFFCWICFAVTSTWVWSEVLSDGQYTENLMPVNYVLLAVISGIIGFVLTGFTAWHFSLAWRGQTTIECLEKTRYLSPLRRSMERQHYQHNQVHANGTPSYGQQLREIHANALPGVTRPEEGEDTSSSSGDLERGLTAQEALRRTYNHREQSRERERYEDYLDEQDSEKLPNAFDHGWRRNLQHLFGVQPLFWFLPICNTSGDGWTWEPNPKWLEVRDQIRRQRELQWRAQERRERDARHGAGNVASPYSPTETYPSDYRDRDYFASQKWQTPNGIDDDGQRHYLTTSAGVASVPASGRRSPGKADQILGRDSQSYVDGGGDYFGNAGNRRLDSGMSMETLRRRNSEEEDDDDEDDGEQDRYEVSSDEEAGDSRKENRRSAIIKGRRGHGDEWREW